MGQESHLRGEAWDAGCTHWAEAGSSILANTCPLHSILQNKRNMKNEKMASKMPVAQRILSSTFIYLHPLSTKRPTRILDPGKSRENLLHFFFCSTIRNYCLCLVPVWKHKIEKRNSCSCLEAWDWKKEILVLKKWDFHSNLSRKMLFCWKYQSKDKQYKHCQKFLQELSVSRLKA